MPALTRPGRIRSALRERAVAWITRRQPFMSNMLTRIGFIDETSVKNNMAKGRVVGKTFLGSRMSMQIAVGENDSALLKAYVDAEIGQSLGSDPVWIGWDADNMAVLND